MISENSFQNNMETSGSCTHTVNLIRVGSKLFSKGKEADAMVLYDSAHQLIKTQRHTAEANVSKQLEWGNQVLETTVEEQSVLLDPPDTYHEDECDVGPRPFRSPVVPEHMNSSSTVAMEACIFYNKALLHQSCFDYNEAAPLYESVIQVVESSFEDVRFAEQKVLSEVFVRAHNNLGHIRYIEGYEEQAGAHFEASLAHAKQLGATYFSKLDFATILSNWCRVHWMKGDITEDLYKALREVLRLRVSVLGWNHIDIASAHYNLGVAEYARSQNDKAFAHFMQYLHVVSHVSKNEFARELDPIPALVYILLMKHEESEDSLCQELVRGLRTLQDKRQDLGPHNFEVASVLNFVGTLLFHQRDFENALIFFREELRLEETLTACEDVSVSVTCNNIGRILQELGRLPEAIEYYHRALKNEYSEDIQQWRPCSKGEVDFSSKMPNYKGLEPSTMNLYSTIWYNLGLIHDKLGSYCEAIKAFQMSLGLRKTILGPDHADVACLLYNIGVLQMEQQMLQDATASFREALRIRRVVATGQLNDQHVVKTLQKLASLHKIKGNIAGSLEALREILHIQQNPSDNESAQSDREAGVTLREIAELYHARGDMELALKVAQESVQLMKPKMNEILTEAVCIEMVPTLLLLGSLCHEASNPTAASSIFSETVVMIDQSSRQRPGASPLDSFREVCYMLAYYHCAPVA